MNESPEIVESLSRRRWLQLTAGGSVGLALGGVIDVAAVQALFQKNVVPSYGRFDLAFSHGSGSYVYDVAGKRYLDLGGGIAVTTLGHANPAITEALVEQSRKLVHVSNLYYHEFQGRLAKKLSEVSGLQRTFFCNSGTEAMEGALKMIRSHGTHMDPQKYAYHFAPTRQDQFHSLDL